MVKRYTGVSADRILKIDNSVVKLLHDKRIFTQTKVEIPAGNRKRVFTQNDVTEVEPPFAPNELQMRTCVKNRCKKKRCPWQRS